MPKYWLPAMSVASIMVAPRCVVACGMCLYASFDHVLPPVWLWCLFANMWFLAASAVVTWRGASVPWVPRIGKALIFSILAWLVSPAFTGPIIFVALMLPAIMATIRAICKITLAGSTEGVNRDLRNVGIAAVLTAVVLGYYSYEIIGSRTEAEYILSWQGTGPAAVALRDLRKRGLEAVEDYRVVVINGSEAIAGRAAELLAGIGRPEVDVPLLIRSLQRFQANQAGASGSRRIEAALRKMSGLDLPHGTSAKEWGQAWQRARQFPKRTTERTE